MKTRSDQATDTFDAQPDVAEDHFQYFFSKPEKYEISSADSSLMFYRIRKWRADEKKKHKKLFPKEIFS